MGNFRIRNAFKIISYFTNPIVKVAIIEDMARIKAIKSKSKTFQRR